MQLIRKVAKSSTVKLGHFIFALTVPEKKSEMREKKINNTDV